MPISCSTNFDFDYRKIVWGLFIYILLSQLYLCYILSIVCLKLYSNFQYFFHIAYMRKSIKYYMSRKWNLSQFKLGSNKCVQNMAWQHPEKFERGLRGACWVINRVKLPLLHGLHATPIYYWQYPVLAFRARKLGISLWLSIHKMAMYSKRYDHFKIRNDYVSFDIQIRYLQINM